MEEWLPEDIWHFSFWEVLGARQSGDERQSSRLLTCVGIIRAAGDSDWLCDGRVRDL